MTVQLGKFEKYLIEEFFDDYRAGAMSQHTFTRRDALTGSEVRHELKVYPGVDHAFHNDTGERYNEAQATAAWNDTIAWFGKYV